MHRAVPHWLLAVIGAVLCVCVIATSVRASWCQRARRLVETTVMVETAAASTSSEPTRSSTLDAAPLDEATAGSQQALASGAKPCASTALVIPVIATLAPVFGAHALEVPRIDSTVRHASNSGIERPPRRT